MPVNINNYIANIEHSLCVSAHALGTCLSYKSSVIDAMIIYQNAFIWTNVTVCVTLIRDTQFTFIHVRTIYSSYDVGVLLHAQYVYVLERDIVYALRYAFIHFHAHTGGSSDRRAAHSQDEVPLTHTQRLHRR